jgi:hypothetical protein
VIEKDKIIMVAKRGRDRCNKKGEGEKGGNKQRGCVIKEGKKKRGGR